MDCDADHVVAGRERGYTKRAAVVRLGGARHDAELRAADLIGAPQCLNVHADQRLARIVDERAADRGVLPDRDLDGAVPLTVGERQRLGDAPRTKPAQGAGDIARLRRIERVGAGRQIGEDETAIGIRQRAARSARDRQRVELRVEAAGLEEAAAERDDHPGRAAAGRVHDLAEDQSGADEGLARRRSRELRGLRDQGWHRERGRGTEAPERQPFPGARPYPDA